MTSILMVIIGIVVLGVLVLIHELGHFLVAKWCGIKVLAFSIGFGKPLLKKTIGDTEYRLSSIPFGGYVKMAGENPEDETSTGAADDFQSKPVWQRILVAVAGPTANFIAAFLMLWFVYIWGVARPLYCEVPILGAVSDSSSAQKAGLRAGDSLVAINGKQIVSWDDIEAAFVQQKQEYVVTYSRGNSTFDATVKPEQSGSGLPKHPLGGMLPPLPAIVADVNPESPASKAGVLAGDSVVSINGEKIYSWFQMLGIIDSWKPGKPLEFVVARGSGLETMSIEPQYNDEAKRRLVGIRVGEGKSRTIRYSPVESISKAAEKSVEYTVMIFDVIGKLVSREVSANQLSGPIGIIPASGFMLFQGLSPLLNFMALIGINLAVLNLMPLVITDGGLIFFLILEAIRGKPLSIKTQILINKIAIMFFLLLFLFVTFNDFRRLPEYFRIFGK
ncbi:MAG: RIP metalloprotease RseP [Fibrobacter sp.]|nr:RIP metalloprotease RseP [Fibrobacter sp.]